MCAYLLVVSLGLALRLEVHRFGILLSHYEQAVLRHALILHGIGTVLTILLVVTVRVIKVNHPLSSKLALAAVPILLLASLDRLVGVAFEPFPENTGLFVAHPTRGWTCRPGWTGRDERAAIRINSQGFRGPELPPHKADDERRILFLGDSVTFGSQIAEKACFVTRVQELAAQRNKGQRITTINAAVAAYSPWQELDLFVNEGLACEPDYVVHVFCLNDVLEKYQLEQFGGYSRGYEPPPWSKLEWSGLFRAARAWRASLRRPTDEELWHLRSTYSDRRLLNRPEGPEVERGWQTTFDNMSKIVSVARRTSLPILMVCVPGRTQVSRDRSSRSPPQAKLSAFADEHGVPFLDLLPLFREHVVEQGLDPLTLFFDPLHLSATGHEVAAVAIHEFLAKQGWLD